MVFNRNIHWIDFNHNFTTNFNKNTTTRLKMEKNTILQELTRVKALYKKAVEQNNIYRIERFGEAIKYLEEQLEKEEENDN